MTTNKHRLAGTLVLEPVRGEGLVPLSFAQQRLWFLDQVEQGGTATYNIPAAYTLTGALDRSALARGLTEIVRRHETLRTRFAVVEGQPFQAIAEPAPFPLEHVDLQALPEPERKAALEQRMKAAVHAPFDLAEGPLVRVTLIQRDAEEHVLLVVMHHIISDAWSLCLFERELWVLYEAYTAGEASPLPELKTQYAEYTHGQRAWLEGAAFDQELAYWKDRLKGRLPVLDLPFARPRPPVQTYGGATHHFALDASLVERLKALSAQERVPLSLTLLAAFKALLFRYTGEEDLIVGAPVANRTRLPFKRLIGFFVNPLVLRTDFSGDPTFREMLQRLWRVWLGAYDHHNLPFGKLVEALQPERAASHTPLFQVSFVSEPVHVPVQAVSPKGLAIDKMNVSLEVSKFDLTVNVTDAPEGLRGLLEYNTDLFDEGTITRMLGHYETLLEGIVSDPDVSLTTLPLLSESERHHVLAEWNDTASSYPGDTCLPTLFEAQAARAPEAVAVVFEEAELTYGALNERANQVARQLQQRGVGRDVRVGLCVERSLDMVVGLLGVLKAGGVYVPMDPADRPDRLAFMMEDAEIQVVLTQRRLLEKLPSEGDKAICLDQDLDAMGKHSEENLPCTTAPDHPAYVIYISDAAERPVGAQIPHRALTNVVYSMQRELGVGAGDVFLHAATGSLDRAALAVFVSLITGARVVVAPKERAADGAWLDRALDRYEATVMQAPPATWQSLVASGWSGCAGLKMLCGGAILAQDVADALLEKGGALWTMYGPAETTRCASLHKVEPGEEGMSIGRPIANTQRYVLDGRLQPVPIGVVGTLYIGGEGLAAGYLNHPDLTAEQFIADPFGAGRLYNTGDRVRYLPDGRLVLATPAAPPPGKVADKASPTPESSAPDLKGGDETPLTPVESLIAKIWQDILEIEHVSVGDNFIDLGGHSVLTTQVNAELEKQLGVRLNPVQLLFQTLGQCAVSCEEQMPSLQSQQGTMSAPQTSSGPIRNAILRLKKAMRRGTPDHE